MKTPAESQGPWDYYKLLGTTLAEEAFAGRRGRLPIGAELNGSVPRWTCDGAPDNRGAAMNRRKWV